MKGRRWKVTSAGLKIGRSTKCEIQVDDLAAELFHCIVKLVDGKAVVSNLASDRGVDVNNVMVDEAEIGPADQIRVGNVRFVLAAKRGVKILSRKGGAHGYSSGIAPECTSSFGGRLFKVFLLVILLLAAAAGVLSHRRGLWRLGRQSEIVTTNRVVRVVGEEIVTTNTVVNVTNIVVKTIPYVVIDSQKALSIGGASGGDEVRLVPGDAIGGDAVHGLKSHDGTNEIIHVFTETAKTKTLVVPPDNKIVPGSVRILVVAGGGAGGRHYGGGGGAGGVVEKNGLTLPVGTSYIYVGEGGGDKAANFGGNGEDSILTIGRTTYTAIGGGAGGTLVRECRIGFAGGSGGGGVHIERGGKALQPGSTTGGLGHAGGDCPHWWTGGGGGGAADTGKDAAGYRSGGKGGESVKSEAVKKIDGGIVSSISGVPSSYAKGGGGRGRPMRNRIKNTGSGGDGVWASSFGGQGGSGIIIVRYATTKTAGDSKNRNPSATFPRPDRVTRTQRIDGVEWRYFVEKGAVTIGCHGENSLNHPDLWIAAVDTNALNGVVHIPGSIGGLPVKKIGKGAFQGCANVTRFVVPEGVTYCEARSFARCAQLKAVIYPRTLEWLGEGQVYRSPNVEAIAFKCNPPKCDFARCPFRGCSYGAKIAIPYDNRAMWRNVGEMDPYLCNDGCHAMRCLIKLFKEGRVLAKRTHAGFIRATFTNAAKVFWHKENDYKDYADKKELLRNYCDEVWKNASKDGADGEHLFMPEYYNDAAKREQPVVAYATMMYFNANEDIRFGFRFRTVSIVVVDETVACLTPMWTPRHRMRYRAWYAGKPCRFERSGWHRVTIVSSGGPGCDDYHYGGMLGGVFYKRGVEKNWHRFEATPDGKTFRVTPDDIRRAVADIEREKLQKKAGKQ